MSLLRKVGAFRAVRVTMVQESVVLCSVVLIVVLEFAYMSHECVVSLHTAANVLQRHYICLICIKTLQYSISLKFVP